MSTSSTSLVTTPYKTPSNKCELNYCKLEPLDLNYLEQQFVPTEDDKNNSYNPFQLEKMQSYIPIYTLFFTMNENNYSNISLNNKLHMVNMNTVFDIENSKSFQKSVFIKYSPLLDPIKYMLGKYDLHSPTIRTLPSISSNENECYKKILNLNNASYVDCFFSFLSSKLLHKYSFKNAIDFYGTYCGIQNKFKMDITDDFEYLNNSDFFLNNINKCFKITNAEINKFYNHNSRANKNKLNISKSSLHNMSCSISLDYDDTQIYNDLEIEHVYEKKQDDTKLNESKNTNSSKHSENDDTSEDENSEEELSKTSDNNSEECDSDSDENEDDESEGEETGDEEIGDEETESDYSNENTVFAYIDNFPVQFICLEKCDGTLDELFENEEIDETVGASVLFQIIMTLLVYQKTFEFTHNDLHTNNIMYIKTDIQYLYYKYNKIYYKVPTYGKIYKIIDFGRSVYKYSGNLFCSDSFAMDGDAATQYNFEPFYNPKKPIILPNYSFDLCRLGCSIYGFIIEDENNTKLNEFQKTIQRWCTDDNDKNVLYKKNGDERYPEFKLYKMIARTVHNHTPENQLKFKYFSKFSFIPKNKKNMEVIDIDTFQL